MRIKSKSKMKPGKKPIMESHKIRAKAYYDPEFKKIVVSFAEKTGNKEARRKFGVPETNIRRWRAKNRQKESLMKKLRKSDLDSMPLEQRLKAPSTSALPDSTEPVLHSQPLSPTKLKVTRQAKPPALSPKPPTPPPPIEEVCLKWNSHHSNMQNTFPSLLLKEQYVDATLVAEGRTLKCHRVILSSCSPYFEEVLASISPYQHPVLFMRDVPFWILKALCDFMYAGEVHILQTKLEELLVVAETLKIKGLAGQAEPQVRQDILTAVKEEKLEDVQKKDEKEAKKKDEKDSRRKDDRETKKKEEKDLRKREERDIKKKDEREVKKKDEKETKVTEFKQLRRREDRELKPKEEKIVKEPRDKKKIQSIVSPEIAVLKGAKNSKTPVQTPEMPVLKHSKSPRSTGTSRRSEKKPPEKEKILNEPNLEKDYLDPLDLLQPVYEEVEKNPKPPKAETKSTNVRRGFQKRIKKRKIPDDREESPPPVMPRKGTRSRPNRKVPKYFHPSDDNSTIVREPHTDQADPLMQLQCIKSEPLFDVEDSIEIEDNLVGFSESSISVEENLLSGYSENSFDYPRRQTRRSAQNLQPIIMDVQSIADKDQAGTLKIVNVDDLKKIHDPLEDPLILQTGSAVVEVADNLGFRISEVVTEKEDSRSSEACREMGFQITNVTSEQDDPKKPAECATAFTDFSEAGNGVKTVRLEVSEPMEIGLESNELLKEKSVIQPTVETEPMDATSATDGIQENHDESPHQDEIDEFLAQNAESNNKPRQNEDCNPTTPDINTDQVNASKVTNELPDSSYNEESVADASKCANELPDCSYNEESATDASRGTNELPDCSYNEESVTVASRVTNELPDCSYNEESATDASKGANELPNCLDNEESDATQGFVRYAEEETVKEHEEDSCGDHSAGNETVERIKENSLEETHISSEIGAGAEHPGSPNVPNDLNSAEDTPVPSDDRAAAEGGGPNAAPEFGADETVTNALTHGLTGADGAGADFLGSADEIPAGESSCANQAPGFHIARVVSEQIAEIEGHRVVEEFVNDSVVANESCEKNFNDLESIVSDLSKIVGESCGESSSGSGSVDDTNAIAESLENLLQK